MSATTTDVSNPPPPSWALILAFSLVYICWGTTYLALKVGVQQERWPPLLFGGVRVCIAGLLVLGWQAFRGQSLAVPRGDRWRIVACGLLLFVCANGLLNIAGQTLESGFLAVLGATSPLWIALLAMLWPHGDRLSAQGWLGLFVGLAGVILLCVPKLQEENGLHFDVGIFCALGSAAAWAFGSLVGRHRPVRCSHLTAAAYQMLLGGICVSLVGLGFGEWNRMPPEITTAALAAFGWLLIFGSLVGFNAYNWLLGHVSPAQIGTHAYMNPAIAVIIGLLDNEEATWWLFAGVIVVLAGVALVRGGVRGQDVAGIAKTPIP